MAETPQQQKFRMNQIPDWGALVADARVFNRVAARVADEIFLAGGVFLRDAPDRAKERLWQILEQERNR